MGRSGPAASVLGGNEQWGGAGRPHPSWEATNNGAERAGRGFRHRL